MKPLKLGLLGVVILMMAACTPLPRKDPAFAPVPAAKFEPPVQSTGSIYQAGYDMRLFEDQTAQRVGDILTIRLVERMRAKKEADLDTSKDNSIEVSAPTLWGVNPATVLGKDMATSIATALEFEGEAEANQSNSLQGDLTVSVIQVLPNGNLRVRGEKRVTLNQGDEFVRLSGIVRLRDITVDNTVLSTQVADATIMYTGNGAVADSSKMGWLSRFLYSAWFPF